MKRSIAVLLALVCLGACQHSIGKSPVKGLDLSWRGDDEAQLQAWLDYVLTLENMNSRELKLEFERLRKNAGDQGNWEEDLRLGLLQSVQLGKVRNFQKASEHIQDLAEKAPYSSQLRAWLKLYSQQLATSAVLEKELSDEKRERAELEKKLKALSDIELEISQRDKEAKVH